MEIAVGGLKLEVMQVGLRLKEESMWAEKVVGWKLLEETVEDSR